MPLASALVKGPRRLGWLRVWVGAALCALSVGCLAAGPAPVREPVSPASAAEVVSALRARSGAVSALSALVTMAYTSPEREGAFEAVVLYETPDKLRVQAFKDIVVDSRDLFDLVLVPGGYSLRHAFEDEPVQEAGPLEGFPAAAPRFSGIYWCREALFLPGAARPTDPIEVLGRYPAGIRVETRLQSGVRAQWDLDPVSLRPLRGIVFAPNRRIQLEYRDYAGRGGAADLPEEVRFRDGATEILVRLGDLELCEALEPEVWTPQ